MNTKTLLGIGVAAVLAYWLFTNTKRKRKSEEVVETPADTNVIPAVLAPLKNRLMLEDIQKPSSTPTGEGGQVVVRAARNLMTKDRIGRRRPVIVPATNLIPNVYDRGVGRELAVSADGSVSGFYNNMSGQATTSMQNACKCADKYKMPYKLDIPEIL